MACRERLQHPDAANADTAIEGFARTYRKAREKFAEARQARTPEALDEWRKQIKCVHSAASALRDFGMMHLRKVTETR
jgi:hypothetical protein